MPPCTRYEPCEVLLQGGIACLLWLEDATASYNTPTCTFDLFLLVSDPVEAARSLRRAGWIDAEYGADCWTDVIRCPFLDHRDSIQLLCLDPTGIEEPKIIPGQLPPPPGGPPPPSRTVLLSARDCNISIEPLLSSPSPDENFIPPLDFLVDGLISSVLDTLPQSQLEARLYLQLVYLYAHCRDIRSPELIEKLRPENRQFHIDALTGPSVGKPPLIAWNRQVRRELQDGTRQLIYENALLAANPAEYQEFISGLRSDFQTLSQGTSSEL